MSYEVNTEFMETIYAVPSDFLTRYITFFLECKHCSLHMQRYLFALGWDQTFWRISCHIILKSNYRIVGNYHQGKISPKLEV